MKSSLWYPPLTILLAFLCVYLLVVPPASRNPTPIIITPGQPPIHLHQPQPWQARKIGFLTSREMADSTILPLFGEQSPHRRHRWNYYTINDTRQHVSSVKLPVSFHDRNCMDEVACDEMYTNDVVQVHGYGTPFIVHRY